MSDATIAKLSVALVGSTGGFTAEMTRATADAERFAVGLQRQIDGLGLVDRSLEVYQLRLRGASDESVRRVERLQSELAALEAARRVEAERQAQMERGAAIARSVETSEQKYLATLRELNALRKAGAIDQGVYNRALAQAATRYNGAANSAQAASGQIAAASGRSTFAVQQLAFGLQDAATVFGTAGFGGAIRAASNNVIQFASIISPLAGTISALVGTGVALLADHFFRTEKNAKAATDALNTYADAVENLNAAVRRQLAAAPDRELTGSKEIGREREAREREAAVLDQAIARRRQLLAGIEQQLARPGDLALTADGARDDELGRRRVDELEKERAALEKANRDDRARRHTLGGRGRGTIEDLRRREEQAREAEDFVGWLDRYFESEADREREAADAAKQAARRAEEIDRLKKSILADDDSFGGRIGQEQARLQERLAEIARLFPEGGSEADALANAAVDASDRRIDALSKAHGAGSKRTADLFSSGAGFGTSEAFSRVARAGIVGESKTDKNTAELVAQAKRQNQTLRRIADAEADRGHLVVVKF